MKISKLPHTEDSIFARMGKVAAEFSAVNLSQGFPDFEPDLTLMESLNKLSMSAMNHQYSPPEGVLPLRESICAMMDDLYGLSFDAQENVTITVGATQAIFTAIHALIHAGDEVIFFEPAFECYEPAIKLAGGVSISLPLRSQDYLPDWSQVEENITSKTKLIIINNPHNPSGSCWPLADMQQLGRIADRHGLWVLSDEVYHNMVFRPNRHVIASSIPELLDRTIIVGSLGKTLHVTGWRLGYAIAPQRFTREFRKIQQFLVYAAATPLQYAVATVLSAKYSYRHLANLFQNKRDRFLAGLQGSRFTWTPSAGAYFQLLDYSGISGDCDEAFADQLVKKHLIASIPLSSFYSEAPSARKIRFCFAKRDETLDRATSILRSI